MPRDVNPEHLHPTLRELVAELLEQLVGDGMPFRLFEGFRGPARQEGLYAQGRTRPGAVVTRARPWESYHQYGLAVDLVLYEGSIGWSWSTGGPREGWWRQLAELGQQLGLESLSFERPHLQLRGLDVRALRRGVYPPDGDWTWAEHLADEIERWNGIPAAPVAPLMAPRRPPLEV